MEIAEGTFAVAVGWLGLLLEIVAAALVSFGGLSALARLLAQAVRTRGTVRFTSVRLHFARYLSLALEFQLAADILATTVAPTWEQLGQLGAVAVIRTGLNYFLGLEMKEEREMLAREKAIEEGAAGSGLQPSPGAL